MYEDMTVDGVSAKVFLDCDNDCVSCSSSAESSKTYMPKL